MESRDHLREPSPPTGLPSGVVTFLLTDVKGSTRLWEHDPSLMAAALSIHDDLVGSAVAAYGGIVLKPRGEGDSTFSVFQRASDAVAAAAALAADLAGASWPTAAPLRLRMALHTGEAVERDGDYYGPTVNRVARLRSMADADQIFVSGATAAVVVDGLDAAYELVDRGDYELPDLNRPERVFELVARVDGPTAEPRAAVSLPLPAQLAPRDGEVFVGRGPQLSLLESAWRDAARRRTVAFLCGEPGIGKTRLASEVARRAHAEGATVLFGRCDEGVGLPYQPFVEAIDGYLAAMTATQVRALAGDRIRELARLLPHLPDRIPGLTPPTRSDPESDRYLLFEAVVEVLSAASGDGPVLLVIDDLHWAATPTLLLLRHLVRSPRSMQIMVVGTYRDAEVERYGALADLLAHLWRDDAALKITLPRLSEHDVLAYLEAAAGHDLDESGRDLGEAVYRETDGNPFFLREVLSHLAETGAIRQDAEGRWSGTPGLSVEDLGLPESVKDVIARRVAGLSERARGALTIASVAAASVSLPLMEDLVGDDALEALEEAVAAGLLVAEPNGFTFSHALVRNALSSELSAPRRMRLHRTMAEAMERLPSHLRPLDALAYHFAEAALDGQLDKATGYAVAAGDEAMERLAYEEAITLYERGIDVAELEGGPPNVRLCELLIGLANARNGLVDVGGAREAAQRAAETARGLGSAEWLGRAAAAQGFGSRFGARDERVISLCNEALAALGPVSSALRAQVLTTLAHHEASTGGWWVAGEIAGEAVAMAREVGDPATLSAALATRFETLGHLGAAEVGPALRLAEELLQLGRAHAHPRASADGHFQRAAWRCISGDIDGSIDDVDDAERVAEELRWGGGTARVIEWRSMSALLHGRFAEAESFADQSLVYADDHPGIVDTYGAQLLWLRYEQGRMEEMQPLIAGAIEMNPDLVEFRLATLAMHATLGHHDEAAKLLDDLARDDFAALLGAVSWAGSLALVAISAYELDAATSAASLYDKLLPHAGLFVILGWAVCVGAADRYLGMLAATCGRRADAEAHFERALDLERKRDLRPHVARTGYLYARLLLAGDDPDRHGRARRLLDDSLTIARELGQARLVEDITALS